MVIDGAVAQSLSCLNIQMIWFIFLCRLSYNSNSKYVFAQTSSGVRLMFLGDVRRALGGSFPQDLCAAVISGRRNTESTSERVGGECGGIGSEEEEEEERRRWRKNTWRRSPAGSRPWSWEVEQQPVDGFRSTLTHYLNLSHMFNCDESVGDSKFGLFWLNRPVRFLQEAKAFNSTLTKVCCEA